MGDRSQPTEPLEPQATVVVYRSEDGELVATHHFAAVAGVELPAREELEALALRQAALEPEVAGALLAVLHVRPDELRPQVAYRVVDGVLVATEPDAAA